MGIKTLILRSLFFMGQQVQASHWCISDYACCRSGGSDLTDCHFCPSQCTGFIGACSNTCPDTAPGGMVDFTCTLGLNALTPAAHTIYLNSGIQSLGTSISTYYAITYPQYCAVSCQISYGGTCGSTFANSEGTIDSTGNISINTDIFAAEFIQNLCMRCYIGGTPSGAFRTIFSPLNVLCPTTVAIQNPGSLASTTLVYEIDGLLPTFPIISYNTDVTQCPILSYDLHTDKTSNVCVTDMTCTYAQTASTIDMAVVVAKQTIAATYNFYVKITAQGGVIGWASDTGGSELFTLQVICGTSTPAPVFTADPLFITTLNVLIGTTNINIYTIYPPTNSFLCPTTIISLTGVTSNSAIVAQLSASCIQPCTQVDLTATNLLSVIQFNVLTTVQGGQQHTSSLATVNIICDITSTVINSPIAPSTSVDIDKLKATPENRFYFNDFTCSVTQCCQAGLTYTVSTTNAAVPTPHASFTSVQYDAGLSMFYTEVDTSIIQSFQIYIHAQNSYGTTGVSSMVTVNIVCGPGSTSITEQAFTGGLTSTQIVPHNSATLTRFTLPSFTSSDLACPIQDYLSSISNPTFNHPLTNFVGNGLETGVGTGIFYISPQDLTLHQEYSFFIKVISVSTDAIFSTGYTLIVGCTLSATISQDPGFVQSFTFQIGGPAAQFTFLEPSIDRSYCPILSHQIINLQVSGPSMTNSEAQFAAAQPNNQILINHGNNLMQLQFKILTTFEGLLTFTSSLITVDVICVSTQIDATNAYNQNDEIPTYWQNSDGKQYLTFKRFICQYEACCTSIHQLVYTMSKVGTPPMEQSPNFLAQVTQDQDVVSAELNTLFLGTFDFWIYAENNLGDSAITQKFSVKIDYNCKIDKISINTDSKKDQSAPEVILNSNQNMPSLLITFNRNGKIKEFKYDFKNWFSKEAPEGYCEIQDYRIEKVMSKGQNMPKIVIERLFKISSQGQFEQIDFLTEFYNYLIFIEVYNGEVWKKFESYRIDASVVTRFEPNFPPFFSESPQTVIIDMNDKNIDEILYQQLPDVVEVNENDKWTMRLDNLDKSFMSYDESNRKIYFDTSKISQSTSTLHFIRIKLEDSAGGSSNYAVQVLIKQPPVEIKYTQKEIPVPEIKHDNGRIVTAKIVSLSALGELKIMFNSKMMTYFNHTHLNSSYVDIYVDPFMQSDLSRPINDNQLNLTWNVTDYKNHVLTIQINFTQPQQISPYIEQDTLVFHVKNVSFFFMSPELGKSLDKRYHTLKTDIRKQLPNNKATQNFVQSSEFGNIALKGILVFSGLLQFLNERALKFFVRLIRALQIIVHLPMFRVVIPANVSVFFEFIIQLVMFDILQPEYSTMLFIDFEEEPSSGLEFDQMRNIGYETDNSVLNLGSLGLLVLFYFVQMILLGILKLIVMRTGKLKELYKMYFYRIFFGTIIFISLEGYFEFLIAGTLNINYSQHKGKFADSLGMILAFITVGFAVIFLPICLARIIWLDIEQVRKKEFRKMFGALTNEMKQNSKWTLSFFSFFAVRRIVFVTVAFWLTEFPYFQLIITVFCNLFMILYQGSFEPLNQRIKNNIELFNEWAIMTATLQFMCFTDFLQSLEAQENVGWSLLAVILLVLIINLFYVLGSGFYWINLVRIKYQKRFEHKYKYYFDKIDEFKQKIKNMFRKNDRTQPKQEQQSLEQNYPLRRSILLRQKDLSMIDEDKEGEDHSSQSQVLQSNRQTVVRAKLSQKVPKKKLVKIANMDVNNTNLSLKKKKGKRLKKKKVQKEILVERRSAPATADNPYGLLIEGDGLTLSVNGYYLNQINIVENELVCLKMMRQKDPYLMRDEDFVYEYEKTKLILDTLKKNFKA